MQPALTIQIPTWKNPDQLRGTLLSMVLYTEFPYKIVVINNDGAEGGAEQVEKVVKSIPYTHIEVVHAGSNLGWMGAHNLALKTCDTPFVCLLNDDVFFVPSYGEFWRQLITPLTDERIGAVGPISNFVMGGQNLWRMDIGTDIETTLLIGFCLVTKTDLLKKVGGLDETLPGGDDLDLSIRIRDAGYRLMIKKSAFLYHIGQQTGRRIHGNNWDSEVMQDRTNNALIRKHGVKKWYDTIQAKCSYRMRSEEELSIGLFEHDWLRDRSSEYVDKSGLNLGCGAMDVSYLKGCRGVDVRPKGSTSGAGGTKFTQSKADIVANVMNIPVDRESQDYLIASHIFEHLVDPVLACKEWMRILKPGGKLFLMVPDLNFYQQGYMLIDYTHLHAYTQESIQNMLNMCGFVVNSSDKAIGGAIVVEAQKPHRVIERTAENWAWALEGKAAGNG